MSQTETIDSGAEATEADVTEALDTATENETQNDEQSEEPTQEAEKDPNEADDGNKQGKSEDWPSTARTAVRNRDRKIAKLHAELRELQSAQQQQPQSQPKSGEPKEEDFDDYGSFLEAKILHKIQSENKGAQKQPDQVDVQEQLYIAQKEQLVAQKSKEYAQTIPDYQEVMSENLEILDYLPPQVQRVFYDADDAALATYNMAKSGQLADLITATPVQAAMMIAQAQSIKPHIPAPPPQPKHKTMQGAKGTGKAGSTINANTDPDKLMQWLEN